MDQSVILSACGLNLYYGENHALKDISIDIKANKITALIGPSGCGKSTFLRTIDRMNDLIPSVKITGSLTFHGQEIYAPGVDVTDLRRRIGMVFQKPNPFPMSIYDNVAYGPRTHGVRSKLALDELVEKSLRQAAIWDEVKDRLKKPALGLSGGQQQRLCIARALAVQPEVLLMDEATSALDPISRPPASPTRPLSSCWATWWSTGTRSSSFPCPRTSAPRTTSPGGLDNASQI